MKKARKHSVYSGGYTEPVGGRVHKH
jgi:hypothetical protein